MGAGTGCTDGADFLYPQVSETGDHAEAKGKPLERPGNGNGRKDAEEEIPPTDDSDQEPADSPSDPPEEDLDPDSTDPVTLDPEVEVEVVQDPAPQPARVTDLSVSATTEGAVTLQFTEVHDGAGSAAAYHVRYAATPLGWGWGTATQVSDGDCADPVEGTSPGKVRSCTVSGLQAGASYDFQLVAFREDESGRVFGELSDIATGTTKSASGDESGGTDEGATDGSGTATLVWPSQPAGFTVLNDQPWDAIGSNGWYHQNRAFESRIVQDPTAPVSPGNVLEHAFPKGFTSGGTEPAIDWIHLEGRTEIFVGMWFKASDPWHGHSSHINKIAFAWSDDHRSSVVLTMRGAPGGPYHFQPVLAGHPDSRKSYFPQNVNAVPMRLGQWHRLEVHFVADTNGRGSLRWWQDGVLLGEAHDVSFAPGGFGQFELAPTWGGVGGPDKAQDDYFRYDHVTIAVPGGG